MDFLRSFSSSPISFLLLIISILWLSMRRRNSTKKKRLPPQADGAWPVLGHLHLLGGPEPPHLVQSRLADKHGPFFSIKIGVHRAVVINSHELARECLTINDRAFASRPKSMAMEILGYNLAMFSYSPFGDYWRHARKMATVDLLSNRRLDSLVGVREAEVSESMKELYQHWFTNKDGSNRSKVEIRSWLADVTLNMTLRIIMGERLTASNGWWKSALKEFFEHSGHFAVVDGLPFLRWFDVTGVEKAMRRTARKLDDILEGWLQEHKKKKLSGVSKEDEDLMDVMLSSADQPSDNFCGYDYDTFVKAMCLMFVLAASDATTVTLTWAVSLLLKNPDVLKKAQEELDEKMGKDKPILREADIENLPYIESIIKETLRLYPPGPLSLQHESIEDCTINSYDVPAGTRLVINISKIQRDPRVWVEPDKFRPERFMSTHKDINVKGQNFELIPFSSGRRMCPGVSLGLRILGLTLANLLYVFDIAMPWDRLVDMEESAGLTNPKANPLNVLLSPRFQTKGLLNSH